MATPEAEKAWKELQKAATPLSPPGDWQLNRPSPEQVQQFQLVQGAHAADAAEKAREFYKKFPNDAKAADAKKRELELLRIAVQLGSTNKVETLQQLEDEKLKDPSVPEEERVSLRVQALQRSLTQLMRSGKSEEIAGAEEKGAREIIKEFPKREEGYEFLFDAARRMDEKKQRTIAEEIVASAAPEDAKRGAKSLLKKLEAIGKPVALKFTAIDKREVDLAKMKGKVVLVDFWATWCGPCVAELPEVKEVYEKLHPKGFEIVGISLDADKDTLEEFLKRESMTWPQYFDGLRWQNKISQEFGIDSIPAMWLVDKKGILRSQDMRGSLKEQVEKLIAEE